MEGEETAYIGIRESWDGQRPFGLRSADRRQHAYLLGKTGVGKSTLLRNLILQDVYAGHGVGLIDPHGDLARDVIDHLPSGRADDLVYFDAADREFPLALDLLARRTGGHPHRVASGIVSAFKAIWHESWGPRLEYVLFATVAALCECSNVSLLGVGRMLSDERYRAWVLRQVKDPVVRAFWLREFAGYDRRLVAEVIAPVQNKVGQILMAPPLRNIAGHVAGKVDVRFMMDTGRLFVANLAKGQLGEDKSNLLGALLTSQFQLATMSRADVPESERRPFHLYIDEFSSFSTGAVSSMLAEARKYGLALVLSHQHTAQLPIEHREAILGNVGTIIAFRVGESDAALLEREFGGDLPASRFSNLKNHQVLVKAMSDGQVVAPFAATTLAPIDLPGGRAEKLIARSREKYARPRSVVEDRILRWMG